MLVPANKGDRRAPSVEHNLETCTCGYEFNKLDYTGKRSKGIPLSTVVIICIII